MTIHFRKLRPNAVTPSRKTPGAAGFDLHVALPEGKPHVMIHACSTARVPTGLAFELPATLGGIVLPRSSWTNRINVLHPPIDSDYRGEVHIIVHNLTNGMLKIRDGERIAQIVFLTVWTPPLMEVEELSETLRGDGGFGSTGQS